MRTFEDRQLFWAFLQNFETTIIKLRKHHCHHCQSTPGWGLFLYCIKCANYPSCGEYERQQSPQLLSYPPTFSSSALRHLQSSVTLAHSILTYSQIYQDVGLDGAILRTEGGNWQQTAQQVNLSSFTSSNQIICTGCILTYPQIFPDIDHFGQWGKLPKNHTTPFHRLFHIASNHLSHSLAIFLHIPFWREGGEW